jgi:putative transposase
LTGKGDIVLLLTAARALARLFGMPRTARAAVGGLCYHVLNRGNGRAEVFHKPEDYDAFLRLMAEGCERLPMRILGFCLMPNHFHLVLRPYDDGDLGRWMQWLMTAHVRRYHSHYHGSGHVWQGRFKAFPIQADEHLLTVLRYVERNPLRAGMVERADAWRWSSLPLRSMKSAPAILSAGPTKLPKGWTAIVNRPQREADEQAVRKCIQRGSPFGGDRWKAATAERLGLESTLRPRGRPRKDRGK